MDRNLLKIIVLVIAVLVIILAGLFFAGAFDPKSRAVECSQEYIQEYGGADCEAVTNQGNEA